MTDTAFELLKLLDSPLLDQMAPELVPFRHAIKRLQDQVSLSGCVGCQKRKIAAGLAQIQLQMQDKILKTEGLAGVLPVLKSSLPKATK
jgi:hypothetical protein